MCDRSFLCTSFPVLFRQYRDASSCISDHTATRCRNSIIRARVRNVATPGRRRGYCTLAVGPLAIRRCTANVRTEIDRAAELSERTAMERAEHEAAIRHRALRLRQDRDRTRTVLQDRAILKSGSLRSDEAN